MSKGSVLVTGAAGFIGFHLSKKLSDSGFAVTGIDNVNSYYDPSLKEARLKILNGCDGFTFHKMDLLDKPSLDGLFREHTFDYVINLAAQAGVGHSISHPYSYLESNVHGFLNILEACRMVPPRHLIYASSSSVYGGNTKLPFSVHDNADHPMALYAASKKANELMAHAYAHLYKIPSTGLRFFSVYGTYGRPDMALFIFTKAILEGKPINIYNFGKMKRDFTYIDDIVTAVVNLIPKIPLPDPNWNSQHPDPATSFAPHRLYNVGNNNPVELMHFLEVLETRLEKKAIKNFMPMQSGDVPDACADISALENEINFKPSTSIEYGIDQFVTWYNDYYTKT
jgi:UDP-glucuronate 4-epimerase